LVEQLAQEELKEVTFFSVPATLNAENKDVNFLPPHLGQIRFFSSSFVSINISKASSQPVHLYSLSGIV